MIRVKCPRCHGIVFLAQFSQPLGQMICHFCSKPIDLADASLADPCWRVDLSAPVPGTWIVPGADPNAVQVGGSTESIGWVLALPILVVLAGLAAVMLWMHGSGQGGGGLMLALAIAMVGTLVAGCYFAMAIAGKVVVQVDGGRGRVFSGIGPIGWERSFDWSKVRGLSERPGWCRTPANPSGLSLVLEGDKPIRFGAMLNDVRRYFIFTALCKQIDQRNAGMK